MNSRAPLLSPARTSDLLVLGVPTFGWAEGRYFLVQSGSGAEIAHYLEARPEAAQDLMLVLRYFDATNFAGMISCETLIGLGLRDPVVPAETVYSIRESSRGAVRDHGVSREPQRAARGEAMGRI